MAQGEVVAISLFAVTIRSRRRTRIVVPNSLLGTLRLENLSHASRRRLELEIPVAPEIPAEKLRAACDAIEEDIRASKLVSEFRDPHVWLSGYQDGMRLKASVWLRHGHDPRDAQRDLHLLIRARFDEFVR